LFCAKCESGLCNIALARGQHCFFWVYFAQLHITCWATAQRPTAACRSTSVAHVAPINAVGSSRLFLFTLRRCSDLKILVPLMTPLRSSDISISWSGERRKRLKRARIAKDTRIQRLLLFVVKLVMSELQVFRTSTWKRWKIIKKNVGFAVNVCASNLPQLCSHSVTSIHSTFTTSTNSRTTWILFAVITRVSLRNEVLLTTTK